jgi:stage II sporulation protein AA (anti-sigma F factor antagonist)
MQVLFKAEKDVLTVYLSGDIDHHTSKNIRESIDSEMQKMMPSVLKLDFRDVHFMDSSGVGLVMGRYKNAVIYGCRVVVSHISSNAEKIMKMSGLEKIITFEKD